MSQVSAQSLFHFTRSEASLRGILSEGFRPALVVEDASLIGSDKFRGETDRLALPMVCFCDIPLRNVRDHLSTYGSYGIGLSREWAFANGLTPVLYVHPKAATLAGINSIGDKAIATTFDELARLISFVKPYSGNFLRGTRQDLLVRFYDEREWRYVPAHALRDVGFVARGEGDVSDDDMAAAAARVKSLGPLKFSHRDIRLLLLARNSEVAPFVAWLRSTFADQYTIPGLDLLITHILTVERLDEDY